MQQVAFFLILNPAAYQEGGDLFLGLVTGKFYANEANANAANPASGGAGNPRVVTYKAASVYYYAWLNPNTLDPTTWTMSPARRNNIYNVNISKFRNIGLSGNPFVPTDPDPNNPDTPDNPDTPAGRCRRGGPHPADDGAVAVARPQDCGRRSGGGVPGHPGADDRGALPGVVLGHGIGKELPIR